MHAVTSSLSLSYQNVAPKAGTPGMAAPESAPGSGSAPAAPAGGGLVAFLPLLMLVPFLFLMFRRNKKEAEARSKLKKGDRVVSTSGLVGELMEIDDRFVKVKIAPGTTVQMLTQSISPLETGTAAASPDKDLKDLKEAKATASEKK